MTDPEVENLLRETFADRPVPAAAVELSPAVRRKSARRRRLTWGAAGVGTLAVLAGAIFTAGALRGPAPVTLDQPSVTPDVTGPATPGWRWESSGGAEVEVPEKWAVNEYGCNKMTPNPSVVRGEVFVTLCLPWEPASKQVALFTDGHTAAPFPSGPLGDRSIEPLRESPVTIDGVPAVRAQGRGPDGRYVGWINVESRQVGITVRTLDEAVTAHILDSFRLVDVDRLGCAATTTWPKTAPPPVAGKPQLAERPASMTLCLYLGDTRLQSSTELTGDTAAGIAAAINSAREGMTPAPPAGECLPEPPAAPDAVLLADGVTITVIFSGCGVIGITDGQHWSRVTKAIVATLMKPTHTGYAVNGNLE